MPASKRRDVDDALLSLAVRTDVFVGVLPRARGRGGSIYDLAALLSGRETRGSDFAELRRELEELMLPPAETSLKPSWTRWFPS